MKVLDLSNYDYDTYDPACLLANGVEAVIIGCQRPTVAEDMIKRAQAAGLPVIGLYGFLYFGIDLTDIDDCIRLGLAYGVPRVWLDCEAEADGGTEAPGQTPATRTAAIRQERAKVEAAGLTAGIYTGGPWWQAHTGNTTEFSGLPLWHAEYGTNTPDMPRLPITEVNYGGWTTLAGHQYSSTIVVCGRGRDHNYWYEEVDSVSRQDYEDLLLATFSGGEERTLSREKRLENARYRIAQRVDGNGGKEEPVQSVSDQASSALALAPASGIPPHTHVIDCETGGVKR